VTSSRTGDDYVGLHRRRDGHAGGERDRHAAACRRNGCRAVGVGRTVVHRRLDRRSATGRRQTTDGHAHDRSSREVARGRGGSCGAARNAHPGRAEAARGERQSRRKTGAEAGHGQQCCQRSWQRSEPKCVSHC